MRGAIIGLALALAVTASACENETELTADGVAEAGRGDGVETTESTETTEPPPETTTTTEAPAATTTTSPPTTTTAKPLAPATTTTTAKAKATTSCHSSYQGTCIPPDVSDADCYPGNGDGPWYVYEDNIKVVGPDVFGLDRDNDGLGCDA